VGTRPIKKQAPRGDLAGHDTEAPDSLRFPKDFVWGAATSAHQIEGGNTNSDWWDFEHQAGSGCAESSGDACDSYSRWRQDLAVVADIGLTSYRFSLEWSRIEPTEGEWSLAALDHYRRICASCREVGIEPTVTFHHFTNPRWFASQGGWEAPQSPALFARFCEKAGRSLGDLIGRACTVNEPNMVALIGYLLGEFPPGRKDDTEAFVTVTKNLVEAHRRAVEALRAGPGVYPIGLALSMSEVQVVPGGEEFAALAREMMEDIYLRELGGDDFVGVQSYSRTYIGPQGPVDPPRGTRLTAMGYEYWPQAAEAAIRRAATATGRPVIVTENGIATNDDAERVEYVSEALRGVHRCLEDGIDVRGYFYWSLLDNFEWAHGFGPHFGLVSVDRSTFARRPKPSARWFGEVARRRELIPAAQTSSGLRNERRAGPEIRSTVGEESSANAGRQSRPPD
jgi:beta-glucosidase